MKVCFVLLYCYPLFDPFVDALFGGSEVRGWHLARGLARWTGHDVSVVVFDHGQPKVQMIDNVRVLAHSGYPFRSPAKAQSSSTLWERKKAWLRKVPGLVALRRGAMKALASVMNMANLARGHATLVNGVAVHDSTWAVYRDEDADLYCSFGVSDLTAEVVGFCRRFGKKAVVMSGSDLDFSEEYQARARGRNIYGSLNSLCHYALTEADHIVVQTARQAAMLRQRFHREGTCVPNPIDLDSRATILMGERFALWVGKADEVKRPDLCLALAERLPEIPFVMIMNRSDERLFQSVLERRPPNVRVVQHVPFHEVERYFARAAVLVNTSVFEGFPNTFLQAGKYGVPIVSLQVDPDDFIKNTRCGFEAAGDLVRLTRGVRLIWSKDPETAGFAENIRSYVGRHHDLGMAVARLEGALRAVVDPQNKEFGKAA